MKFNTIADVVKYRDKYETYFGEFPWAVNVTLSEWNSIRNEARQFQRFLSAENFNITSLDIEGTKLIIDYNKKN